MNDSDEEYVLVTECNFKRQAWQSKDHFVKLLEVACPNHKYPIKHKLKDCTTIKNFMTSGVSPVARSLRETWVGRV
jgi:hypothetical protein